jgi:EAL domain-containing protein (putative c-di-GMP-specific phosphodiesterase class I)
LPLTDTKPRKPGRKGRPDPFDPNIDARGELDHSASEEQRDEVLFAISHPEAIVSVFQPIVELSTGNVAGYEALARFPRGDGRPPNAWFAQAHRCGLGPQLEAKALRCALGAHGPPARTYLSVNLSPSALLSPEAAAELPESLDGIVIELTENELVTEGGRVLDALAELKARGARVSVDDVGSGYASLRQLMRLRPDIIKLDRSLVSGIDEDPAKVALLESFVRFARRTGAHVCAEGVETLAELATLADLDITFGQGYVFAKPSEPWVEPAADARELCRQRTERALASPYGSSAETEDRAFERVSAMLAYATTPEQLGAVMPALTKLLGADEAAFSLVFEDSTRPYVLTLSEHDWGGLSDGERFDLADYPETARVVATGEAHQVLASDPASDPAELRVLEAGGYRGLLMLPVVGDGRTLGLLELYSRSDRPWTRLQITQARILCHQIGATMALFARGRRPLRPSTRSTTRGHVGLTR